MLPNLEVAMQLDLNMSFFLSAKHWVTINGNNGQPHNHIWEIGLKISSENFARRDLEVGFGEIESLIRGYISKFEGKTLNCIKPFDKYNPSTENLGVYLAYGLKMLLSERNFVLEELSIKESPTRGFTVKHLDDEVVDRGADGKRPSGRSTELPVDFLTTEFIEIPEEVVSPVAVEMKQPETGNEEVAVALEDNQTVNTRTDRNPGKIKTLSAITFLVIFNMLLYYPVLFSNSPYPWGSDAWAHLYKGEFLYNAIKNGDFFPRYMSGWDNGIDPFRYWAPLSYYSLALLRFLTGNIFRAFYLLLFLASTIGSCSWLFFRNRMSVINTVMLGVLWAVAPYNLLMAFGSGNTPWVLALIFLPLLMFLVIEELDSAKNNRFKQITLIIIVNLIVLSHAMLAAIFLASLVLYILLAYILGGTSIIRAIRTVMLLSFSLLISAWWLLPSQIGGVNQISPEAVTESIVYYSPLVSLNPFLRLSSPETFYFGLGYLIVAAVAVFQWKSKNAFQQAGTIIGLLIFAITTPSLKPLYNKLPLHHLLWPERFISVAIAFLLLGGIDIGNFKNALKNKRIWQLAFSLLLAAIVLTDSLISTSLIKTRDYPTGIDKVFRQTLTGNGYKAAVLDLSRMGSVPSFLITEKYKREQIFGAAWQGAQTSQNLMALNAALERGWYSFLFDRLIEMGATHLIVRNDVVKEKGLFQQEAYKFGYLFAVSDNGITTYFRSLKPYTVTADYKILGIGRFNINLAMMFPEIKLGNYTQVDKYTLPELQKYKTIILSGFNWVSKKEAEALVLAYAQSGGRVVIDLTGVPSDISSNRTSFLGAIAEPVIIDESPLISLGSKQVRLANLPEENLPWKTFVLEGMDKVSSLVNYYERRRPIEGYKVYRNTNIYFVGLNLPFYALLTKDNVVLNMLGELLGTNTGRTIERNIVEFDQMTSNNNKSTIKFRLPNKFGDHDMIVPIAYLDSMNVNFTGPGEVKPGNTHNLVQFSGAEGDYIMNITYNWPPSTKIGGAISIIGIILCAVLLGGRTAINKIRGKSLPAVILACLLLIFTPKLCFAAENIVMDGHFEDWEEAGYTYIDDPPGDIIAVSEQTSTAGDTKRLYWGANRGESNLYFSIIRYPSNVKDEQRHKMTGKLFFDINNNGKYTDTVDKAGLFQYNPNSGEVRVRLYNRDSHDDSPTWKAIGDWGERKDDGTQFEFYFPFEKLGLIVNQPVRFYATTAFSKNDNPKSDDDWVLDDDFDDFDLYKHDFDLIPNTGDIQYTPVPVLGYFLLIVLMTLGLGAGTLTIKKGKTRKYGQTS